MDSTNVDLYIIDERGRHRIPDYDIREIENEAIERADGGPKPPMYLIDFALEGTPSWIGSFEDALGRVDCRFEHPSRGVAEYEGTLITYKESEDVQKGELTAYVTIRLPAGGGVPWDDADLSRVFGEEIR